MGSNEEYGARPLRRAVQQYVEDPLAEMLLREGGESNKLLVVRPSDIGDRLVFELAAPAVEGAST